MYMTLKEAINKVRTAKLSIRSYSSIGIYMHFIAIAGILYQGVMKLI